MKFFLDENFPKTATVSLGNMGHQVFDLRGTAEEGAADDRIFAAAQNLGAVFLTTDRDFFHTIPHLHETHCGIIVIALKKPNRAAIMEKLFWILNRLKPEDFTNRAIQLRDRAWIAKPPIQLTDESV
jgi:predicted nuclease of predicted toxin-antitoxin system